MWCDNLDATYISVNPIMHSRTKHIEVDFQLVRDRLASKSLQVAFISSKDQVEYVFTKPLASNRFLLLRWSLTIASMLDSREADRMHTSKDTSKNSSSPDVALQQSHATCTSPTQQQ